MPTPDYPALADSLLGTHGYPETVLERHGALEVDEDEIDEHLLDHGIEKCPQCGWWVESGEVVDEDGEIVPCGSC